MNYRYKSKNKNLKLDTLKEFKKIKNYSVILPTYNEEDSIKRIITALQIVLKKEKYEIIIVDDNSKDKTPEIIDNYNSESIVALHRYGKRGILSAIVDGVKISRSHNIILMDADFSHPPNKIKEMMKYIKKYDLVTCSRFAKGGGMEAPLKQKYSTILFNYVIRMIFLDTKITDFTGGYHMIKRDKFLKLNFKYPAVWGEFDIELLYRSKLNNYKMKEIPYVYKYRMEGFSKSQNYFKYAYIYWKMALKMKLFR